MLLHLRGNSFALKAPMIVSLIKIITEKILYECRTARCSSKSKGMPCLAEVCGVVFNGFSAGEGGFSCRQGRACWLRPRESSSRVRLFKSLSDVMIDIYME